MCIAVTIRSTKIRSEAARTAWFIVTIGLLMYRFSFLLQLSHTANRLSHYRGQGGKLDLGFQSHYSVVTPKVVEALVDAIPIVTPAFIDECEVHKQNLTLPSYQS